MQFVVSLFNAVDLEAVHTKIVIACVRLDSRDVNELQEASQDLPSVHLFGLVK